MKVEEIIVPIGLSIVALAILSKAAKAAEIKKDVLIIRGTDNIITDTQTELLVNIIKSEGNYNNVWIATIDPNAYGGDNFTLTGVELVRYIIKFLSTSNPNVNVDGIIIISNGKDKGGIPPAQINGFVQNAHADMVYGSFDDSFEYHASEDKYYLKVGKKPHFDVWVSRISTYSQQRQNGISNNAIIDQYLIKRTNYQSSKTIKWWNSWRDSTSCYPIFDKAGYFMTDNQTAKYPTTIDDILYNQTTTKSLLSSDYGIVAIIGEGTWQAVDHFSYQDVNDTPIGGHGILMFVGSCSVGLWNLPYDVNPNTVLTLNILNSNTLQIPLVFGFTDLGGTDICINFKKGGSVDSFPEALMKNKTWGDAYLEWLNSAVWYDTSGNVQAGINPACYQMFGDGSISI